MFRSHNTTRKGASKLRNLDFAERHGYIKGIIKEIGAVCCPASLRARVRVC